MTYDEKLAERIRRALPPTSMITDKKMFGGLAFLLDGKMVVGVVGSELMARVGPAAYEAALAQPHARPMDFTGRPLTGFVFVGSAGVRTTAAVETWVRRALTFVETLPSKPKQRRPRPRKAATGH